MPPVGYQIYLSGWIGHTNTILYHVVQIFGFSAEATT